MRMNFKVINFAPDFEYRFKVSPKTALEPLNRIQKHRITVCERAYSGLSKTTLNKSTSSNYWTCLHHDVMYLSGRPRKNLDLRHELANPGGLDWVRRSIKKFDTLSSLTDGESGIRIFSASWLMRKYHQRMFHFPGMYQTYSLYSGQIQFQQASNRAHHQSETH